MKNKDLKKRIIQISYDRSLCHLGSNLTAVDIIDEIYQTMLMLPMSSAPVPPPLPKFILSSGHAHLAHLVVMEKYKIIDDAEEMFDKHGVHCERVAGCDASTGSLGHGIGIAVGIALADRSKNVYCLLSDGELSEGSVFEACNVIQDQRISNLRLYINNNGYAGYRETYVQDFFADWSMFTVIKTSMNKYPEWLRGQEAHYVIMNQQQYEEVLGVLK